MTIECVGGAACGAVVSIPDELEPGARVQVQVVSPETKGMRCWALAPWSGWGEPAADTLILRPMYILEPGKPDVEAVRPALLMYSGAD